MSSRRLGVVAATVVLFAATLLAVSALWMQSSHNPVPVPQKEASDTLKTLYIAGIPVRVGVVETPAARQRGLSGRPSLAPDEGLLFVFDSDGTWAFWMKDMRFSIDMVWIDSAGKVVFIKEHATPESYTTSGESFRPDVPARYVLELPDGFCASHNVRVGSTVSL